jgi:[ribosomal protein S5]-alanine N-acetyltransferase
MTSGRQPTLSWVELEGERALLRPVRPSDAEHAFPLIHGRREVLDGLIWQGPATLTELADHWMHWATPGEVGFRYLFAIVDKPSARICGTIGLRFHEEPFRGDTGYWIGSPFWGQGIGTEAIGLLSHLAFRHLEARTVGAEVFLGNTASCRVLEKNHFVRAAETITREVEGGRREEWVYDLDRERYLTLDPLQPLAESVLLEPTGR